YQAGYEEKVFEALWTQPYVTDHTLLILEAQKEKSMNFLGKIGYEIIKEKNYKTNKHVFVRKARKE
ncbi:MAG: 16S rRNA (guanine(966)-N(2))-methyltransferase RsmD, partial [Lachnospiraceae bacterium]|nr:16S rRNA (guanine(966)-N(2))-methyltransferase RsmD [Lachnospiraceae bacterium]